MSRDEKLDRAMRLSMELLVNYKKEGQSFDDFCANLSSTGIFIETTYLQEVGSKIDLTFILPHSQEKLNIIGTVKWARKAPDSNGPAGMGVQFDSLSPVKTEALNKAINYYNSLLSKKE